MKMCIASENKIKRCIKEIRRYKGESKGNSELKNTITKQIQWILLKNTIMIQSKERSTAEWKESVTGK